MPKKFYSDVLCSVLVKFVSEDHRRYNFDDSWNVNIGEYNLSNFNSTRLKISFTFKANLISKDKKGNTTALIPDEGLKELQSHLENLEILLDLLTLQVGTSLVIEDGSIVCSGVGYSSRSEPVTNTNKLVDVQGTRKRYENLVNDDELINAIRFFRLAQSDRENNGKAIKLWAALEALYKNYSSEINTLWNEKLSEDDKKKLKTAINSLSADVEVKKELYGAITSWKSVSKNNYLSKKIKLMNSRGEIKPEDVKRLIDWWSKPRHSPAHGSRIERMDEDKKEAIGDFENTLESLLLGMVNPALFGYFVGNPNAFGNKFWDKNDYTVQKLSKDCWIKPSHFKLGIVDSLLSDIAHQKVDDDKLLLYVVHDKVIRLNKTGIAEIEDLSILPEIFKDAINKTQIRLNRSDKLKNEKQT